MLEAQQRDLMLTARHLRSRAVHNWGRTMLAWERRSPRTYFPAQRVYHTLHPGLGGLGHAPPPKREPDAALPYGEVLNFDGVRILVDERLSPRQVRKLTEGRHTQHERGLLLSELDESDVVMELGGGIGMLSAAIALKIGDDRVHSYEANPELSPLIEANYQLNGVQPQIKMCMLGRGSTSCTFHVSSDFSRSNAYASDDRTHPVEVPVEPLNGELKAVKPSVLVLDIQGGEGEILQFADLSSIRLLMVEMHPDLLGIRRVLQLRRRLRKNGFSEVAGVGQCFLYRRD